MSPRLPQTSGERLVSLLESIGYSVVRQKGSHIRLRKAAPSGEHNITVPNHKTIAKGTLNDILTSIALHNALDKEELISRL